MNGMVKVLELLFVLVVLYWSLQCFISNDRCVLQVASLADTSQARRFCDDGGILFTFSICIPTVVRFYEYLSAVVCHGGGSIVMTLKQLRQVTGES